MSKKSKIRTGLVIELDGKAIPLSYETVEELYEVFKRFLGKEENTKVTIINLPEKNRDIQPWMPHPYYPPPNTWDPIPNGYPTVWCGSSTSNSLPSGRARIESVSEKID